MQKVSSIRMLANLAKQRMKMGNYKEIVATPKDSFTSAVSASTYFLCNARALRKEYVKAEIVTLQNNDKDFETKVVNILKNGDMLFNPIGQLVDNQEFSKMNEYQKQQYVLSLCEKYNRVKQDYYSGKLHIA